MPQESSSVDLMRLCEAVWDRDREEGEKLKHGGGRKTEWGKGGKKGQRSPLH